MMETSEKAMTCFKGFIENIQINMSFNLLSKVFGNVSFVQTFFAY